MAKINLEVIQCDECGSIQPAMKAEYYTVHGYIEYTAIRYEHGRLMAPRSADLLGNRTGGDLVLCQPCFKKKVLAADSD